MPTITPQFTLDALYISPFTARRSFDDNGTPVYTPIDRLTRPSGIDLLDRYVQHLTAGGRRETFCRLTGLTTGELNTFVRLLTGLTAPEFTRQYSLRLAADLLRFTDMDVREVARRSGFNGVATFHRYTRKLHNVTPQEYRRHLRQKGDAGRYRV